MHHSQVMPSVVMWDEMGKVPTSELYQKMGASGILAARIGPGPHLKVPGINLLGGVKPEVAAPFLLSHFPAHSADLENMSPPYAYL